MRSTPILIVMVFLRAFAVHCQEVDIVSALSNDCFSCTIELKDSGDSKRVVGVANVSKFYWGHSDAEFFNFSDQVGGFIGNGWDVFIQNQDDKHSIGSEVKAEHPLLLCCKIEGDSIIRTEGGFVAVESNSSNLIDAMNVISKASESRKDSLGRIKILREMSESSNQFVADFAIAHLLYWTSLNEISIRERIDLALNVLGKKSSSPVRKRYAWSILEGAIAEGFLESCSYASAVRHLSEKDHFDTALREREVALKIEDSQKIELTKWILSHLSDSDEDGKIRGVAIKGKIEVCRKLIQVIKSNPMLRDLALNSLNSLTERDNKIAASLINDFRNEVVEKESIKK